MAKEYIERETVKAKKVYCEERHEFVVPVSEIDWIPTADVQEVRHGKNVTTMNPVDEFECSECGFVCEIYENIYDDEYTLDCQRECNPNFCPDCGAKMDKE